MSVFVDLHSVYVYICIGMNVSTCNKFMMWNMFDNKNNALTNLYISVCVVCVHVRVYTFMHAYIDMHTAPYFTKHVPCFVNCARLREILSPVCLEPLIALPHLLVCFVLGSQFEIC